MTDNLASWLCALHGERIDMECGMCRLALAWTMDACDARDEARAEAPVVPRHAETLASAFDESETFDPCDWMDEEGWH